MASFVVAGSADSTDYARAERLADLLLGKHPGSVSIAKLRKSAAAWPRAREALSAALGLALHDFPAGHAVVFTGAGKLIGNSASFAELCRSSYAVELDVTDEQVAACIRANVDEAERQSRQTDVRKQLRGGGRALILIDIQNDFCPGGALAVADGDAVVPLVNRLRHTCNWDAVVLTQDWHPRDHASFASNNPGASLFTVVELEEMGKQMMWPDHCVQGTPGADFHPHLDREDRDVVVRKGMNSRVDSYSGFGDAFGHKLERTPLADVLKAKGVTDVFVTGLAYDYCVAYTCKDAAREGFNVFCVRDATRGIAPDSSAAETAAMTELGVHLLEHADDVPTKDIDALFAGAGAAGSGGSAAAGAGGAAASAAAAGAGEVGASSAEAPGIAPGRAVAATGAITIDLREVLLA